MRKLIVPGALLVLPLGLVTSVAVLSFAAWQSGPPIADLFGRAADTSTSVSAVNKEHSNDDLMTQRPDSIVASSDNPAPIGTFRSPWSVTNTSKSMFTSLDTENQAPAFLFKKVDWFAKADEGETGSVDQYYGKEYFKQRKQRLEAENIGKPADDLEGALQYEFNMTKDPATGRIPKGIYEAERAQANEILQRQRSLFIPELGSYSFVGPDNLGGRTRTIAYDVRYNGTTNRIILAGGVSGGVYKSTDDGATWVRKSPTGEHFSCTSIAQDTRVGFQDTWYYGVGESSGNSASGTSAFYLGNGVYKSTDNGETWARLTTSNTSALETFSLGQDAIQKVIVDPTDGNVYVACLAKIMRSTDGGTTWVDVLPGVLTSTTNTTDVVVSSTGRLYASFSGTNSSTVDGVWASPPGATSGDPGTWTRIAGAGAGGSPVGWNAEGAYGRVVLAIAPSLESRLYALYWNSTTYTCGAPAPEAELFYWDDIGGTWTDISPTLPDEAGCLAGNDPFAAQGGYDLVIAVKPDAAGTIFIGGTNAYRSTDTGATWTRIGGYATTANYALYASSHPDIHSFVFQPGTPTTMLCGNDGGIQRTTDDLAGTVAWSQINTGYRTYQYYYVANDPRSGNTKVIGGSQDNGTTRNVGGVGSTFEAIFGGDGVSVGLSGATDLEYVGFQFGNIFRRSAALGSGAGTLITPTGEADTGLFVTLFKLDPDNTERFYYANDNKLYRTASASTVASGTWTEMTGIGTAVGSSFDITAIGLSRGAYSAATSSLFFGTSNGRVFRLDDPTGVAAATAPVEISLGAGFPAVGSGNISSISASPADDGTILVTFSNYGVTSVFWTGAANTATPAWTAVEGALTLPSYRSSAIVDTGAGGLQYFVGTSAGLYNTGGLPGSPAWTQEGPTDMGNSVVSSLDLRASDNKLLVGTHGYGMWTAAFAGGATPPKSRADFDGDGKTDVSVYRPGDGNWYMNRSTAGFGVVHWGGVVGDVIVPGDYDGDGKADYAIWRPTDTAGVADFYILNSAGFTVSGYSHGLTTDTPVSGDFDGDSKSDIVVWRPSTGTWYVYTLLSGTTTSAQFGLTGDIPMAIDNDGDGKANYAVFRPGSSIWYIAKPTGTPATSFDAIGFGLAGDVLVPADYDGDSKDDVAVFRPSNGTWYIRRSTDSGTTFTQFGAIGDVPVPGDYDGDGKDDVAVYRAGLWYIFASTSGFSAQAFGTAGDTAIPAKYHP